jgi:hypothetical protein
MLSVSHTYLHALVSVMACISDGFDVAISIGSLHLSCNWGCSGVPLWSWNYVFGQLLTTITVWLILSFFLEEPTSEHCNSDERHRKGERTVPQMRRLVGSIFKLFTGNRTMGWLAVFCVGVYACSEMCHQFKGIFLLSHGVGLAEIGVWDTVAFGLSSLGSFASAPVSKLVGEHIEMLHSTHDDIFSILSARTGVRPPRLGSFIM